MNAPCSLVSFGPVHFAEKTSRNTVLADLLWEKNTVPTEKTSWKRRIIREANSLIMTLGFDISTEFCCSLMQGLLDMLVPMLGEQLLRDYHSWVQLQQQHEASWWDRGRSLAILQRSGKEEFWGSMLGMVHCKIGCSCVYSTTVEGFSKSRYKRIP